MRSVYCIENKINSKKYIGLSNNPKRRFIQHKSKLRRNEHANEHLQKDWNKYGEENFFIYTISDNSSFEDEIQFIYELNTKFPNGYNLTDGGVGLPNPEKSVRDGISKNHKDVSGENNPRFGKKLKNSSSKYYGVSIHKIRGKIFWMVGTKVNGKQIYIGQRRTEEEAAELYNQYIISNNLNYPINKIKKVK